MSELNIAPGFFFPPKFCLSTYSLHLPKVITRLVQGITSKKQTLISGALKKKNKTTVPVEAIF